MSEENREQQDVKKGKTTQLNIRLQGKTRDNFLDILAYFLQEKRRQVSNKEAVSIAINYFHEHVVAPKTQQEEKRARE